MTGKKRGNAEHLTPFKKGVSGNPKGRPKGSRDSKTIITEQLARLARDENGNYVLDDDGEPMTWGELMHAKQIQKAALLGDTTAFNALMDRQEGKAKQITENTNKNVDMSHEAWIKEANAKAKATQDKEERVSLN